VPGYRYRIPAPGSLKIEEIEKTVTVETTGSFQKPGDNYKIILPYSSVKFPLTVRSPLRTDKYVKINTVVNQKVIEMIRASGVPSELRNLCPVVLNGDGEIIWVTGSPAAGRFKVKDKKGKKFLKISTRLCPAGVRL